MRGSCVKPLIKVEPGGIAFTATYVKALITRKVKIMKLLVFTLLVLLTSCGNSDNNISEEINAKLTANNPNVRATVKDGVVTLTGTCPDASCKNVSETAASNVEGVERVINEIRVASPGG